MEYPPPEGETPNQAKKAGEVTSLAGFLFANPGSRAAQASNPAKEFAFQVLRLRLLCCPRGKAQASSLLPDPAIAIAMFVPGN